MHPVLTTFEWGGAVLPLPAYGLCLLLALAVGSALALRATVRAGLDAGAMIAACASAVLGGLFGAYLMFAAVAWTGGLPLTAALVRPGLVFYGGALGAFASFCLVARRLSLPAALALDLAAPALPLAHALGRIGCFLGGCCYGAPTHAALAVTYGDGLAPGAHPAIPRHPWPLYEAALLLVVALVVRGIAVDPRRPGRRFAAYVLLYAAVRFGLEPLRGDALRGVRWGVVSTSQLCAALTVLAALLFARMRRQCT